MKGYFLAVLLVFSLASAHAQQSKTDQSCFSGESTKQCQQRKIDALLAQMDANAAAVAIKEIPVFDVDAHCDAVAQTTGQPSEVIRHVCLVDEQRAYDRIKANWAAIPADSKKNCEAVARSIGPPAYSIMETCVEQDVQALQQNKSFHFQR